MLNGVDVFLVRAGTFSPLPCCAEVLKIFISIARGPATFLVPALRKTFEDRVGGTISTLALVCFDIRAAVKVTLEKYAMYSAQLI